MAKRAEPVAQPWAYEAFGRAFGDRYRTLRAGEELQITAAAA